MNAQHRLYLAYLRGLTTFGIFDYLKLHLVALRQGPEPLSFNGTLVNKYVFTTIVWSYEAEALSVVKPFHCSCSHVITSFPSFKKPILHKKRPRSQSTVLPLWSLTRQYYYTTRRHSTRNTIFCNRYLKIFFNL